MCHRVWRGGDFYDLCQKAQNKAQRGHALTDMDFKFHFFPWWRNPDYVLDADIEIPVIMRDYFNTLRDNHGIELGLEQKKWYVKKHEIMGEAMKREHPSTSDEPFQV